MGTICVFSCTCVRVEVGVCAGMSVEAEVCLGCGSQALSSSFGETESFTGLRDLAVAASPTCLRFPCLYGKP